MILYSTGAAAGASGAFTASGYTMTSSRLLGRTTASTGAPEELTVGTSLLLSAGSLNTVQGILTSSTPDFAGMTIGGAAATGKLTVKGNGTTTGHAQSITNSSGTETAAIQDNGVGLFFGKGGVTSNTVLGTLAGASLTSATDSILIGRNAGNALTTQSSNVFIGGGVGYLSTGTQNTFVGLNAGENMGSSGDNSFYGAFSGNSRTGAQNTIVGAYAGYMAGAGAADDTLVGWRAGYTSSGGGNTLIGRSAGYSMTGGGVALGKFAGLYETGTNAFYVDNQDRTDLAGGKAKSLLYGTFNATASSQTLVTNSKLTATYGLAITSPTVPATASDTGVVGTIAWDASYIYVCTATNTWKRIAILTW